MRIFKFGGASVKNADGVKNLIKVLDITGASNLLIVVSAMGKTTNALEKIVKAYLSNDKQYKQLIGDLREYHYNILKELFVTKQDLVFDLVEKLFKDLNPPLERNKSTQFDYVYDQVVGYGELMSTTIVSQYLNNNHYGNEWLDVRELIKTDSSYRGAKVDWKKTQDLITKKINQNTLTITQGFIGSDSNNFTTTLGREGSDYTAGIFGYCIGAASVSIWKDVPGVLNGDPRVFNNTELLSHISYNEAIELAFYGASVIHPKTIQPLQRKEIPLYVKSFSNPNSKGTSVKKGQSLAPYVPCYIVKKNQILVSLSSLDFSFIVEENISEIFSLFHQNRIKVDLVQNSAISFSVCFENSFNNLEALLLHLKAKFKVTCSENVSLYTIRHYNQKAISNLEADKIVLLKQMFEDTLQIVTK